MIDTVGTPFPNNIIQYYLLGLTLLPFHSIIVEWTAGSGRFSIVFFLFTRVYSNLESSPRYFFLEGLRN
jgi:hypothetical protein